MLYHVSRNGQNYGPYTLEDLQRYVTSGNVLPTDLAKSDEMPEWVPVSQVLGASMPAAPAPVAAYGGGAPAYPATAGIYPDPPNLHWALVLVIGVFTCGLFSIVWMFVQAAWMRKVNPNSKALTYYIAAILVYVIAIVAQVAIALAGRNGSPTSTFTGVYFVCLLVYFVLFLVAIFTMRSDMEAHFNGPEPIGLSLSGVMTFFFNVLYFQYHFTRINELKHAARYRGAQI
ncbi:MAG: GYF domain-containing protein [Acidobacteriaceae bacterium]|jgi:hypothetical protein